MSILQKIAKNADLRFFKLQDSTSTVGEDPILRKLLGNRD